MKQVKKLRIKYYLKTLFYFETDEKAKAEIARLTKLKQQRKLA